MSAILNFVFHYLSFCFYCSSADLNRRPSAHKTDALDQLSYKSDNLLRTRIRNLNIRSIVHYPNTPAGLVLVFIINLHFIGVIILGKKGKEVRVG